MLCIHCNNEIESDDNFCWNCGKWTSKGYSVLKEENSSLFNGSAFKKTENLKFLVSLFCFSMFLFMIFVTISGNDLFKPIVFLQKKVNNYVYGYNTSVINSQNVYNNKNVNTIDEAYSLIKSDFTGQYWKCYKNLELASLENELMSKYDIPSVTFCDISYDESLKISRVINKIYEYFPTIKGYLTNISITNSINSSEIVAYFQPMYQFVNSYNDIFEYNKVNKTQILLNSYYFLNDDILSENINDVVGDGWYVKDATWESVIAHEFGHYISFVVLLKKYDLDNITLETNSNTEIISSVIDDYDSGVNSENIVKSALNNYNLNYNLNLTLNEFALSISRYAGALDSSGNLIYDEVIAEAVHDYYIHGDDCETASYEIVRILKSLLQGENI